MQQFLDVHTIGGRIKIARLEASMTQAQLAERVHAGMTSIRRYEKLKIRPRKDVIDRIASVLGVNPAWIAYGDSKADKYKGVKLENGFYHLYSPLKQEPTLAYLYSNPDTQCRGFGFNTADGGGFVPLDDLSKGTKVVPIKIQEVQ